MAKKNEKRSSRLPYDVSRVSWDNLEPLDLTRAERNDVIKSFQPHTPSDKFFSDYERAVQFFVWDVEEVRKVTPSKLSARIKDGIHENAHQLLSGLQSLEITDLCLLDRHFTRQFLQNRKCVSVNRFISYLTLFMENTAEAVRVLEDVQKGGRMPAFAEQGLALSIGQAIQAETGKLPMLTRNGVFSRVLKCALSVGDKRMKRRVGKDRRDVMDLMRQARDAMMST
jgi:hypothetical protein